MTCPPSPLTMLLSRHTRRRAFIALWAARLAAWSASHKSEAGNWFCRLGSRRTEPEYGRGLAVFIRALANPATWRDTQSISNSALRRIARALSRLAQELVSARPSVIYAWTTAAAVAVARATKTIPIIIGPAGEPVMAELAGDFSRPRANVTGLVFSSPEQAAKSWKS